LWNLTVVAAAVKTGNCERSLKVPDGRETAARRPV
jgi:hypothetical protein